MDLLSPALVDRAADAEGVARAASVAAAATTPKNLPRMIPPGQADSDIRIATKNRLATRKNLLIGQSPFLGCRTCWLLRPR
jgi:hypothetical protein